MTFKFSCLVLGFFLIAVPSHAEQENFPFVGTIKSDRVNVRAGQSKNFEKLYQFNKGDEVVVLEKSYGWYKIKLPAAAKSYISGKYVQVMIGDGLVTADKVNIRAEPGYNATSLGQVKKGDKVQVVEKVKDWYRIIPTEGSYGWVADEYIKFKSQDISTYQNSANIPSTDIITP